MRLPANEKRTPQQLRKQYEIEQELAERLRHASPQDRPGLYRKVYVELHGRVPHHSQFSPEESRRRKSTLLSEQMALLRRFLRSDSSFLELGAGDCALSLAVCPHVAKVQAVDVADQIKHPRDMPDNFRLIISEGCGVPDDDGSIDLIYSHQLTEHLHPDDVLQQSSDIYRALRPGGLYLCVTPNRLSGPHDISKYFDRLAKGLHLKEYTAGEIDGLLAEAGFRRRYYYLKIKSTYVRLPRRLVQCLEVLLGLMPNSLAARLGRCRPVRALLGIRVAAFK